MTRTSVVRAGPLLLAAVLALLIWPSATGAPVGPIPVPRAPGAAAPQLRLRPMIRSFPPSAAVDLERLLAPDISIEEVQFSPSTYVPPQDVTVRVTIRNIGREPTGEFHLRWKPYETHAGEVKLLSNINAGDQRIARWTYRFTSRTEETFFEADCYDEVAERNESNNEAQGHPMVGASAWDFYVEDIWLVKEEAPTDIIPNPVGGEDYEVVYKVGFVNTVNDEAMQVRAHVYVDGEERHSFPFRIPSNQTRVTHFSVNLPAGEHTIRATATPPEEVNTANNELTETIVWRTRPQAPYRFEYYAINRYDLIGGGGNLPFSINEGRKFYWKMDEHHQTCSWWAENDGVYCDDWAYGARARANWADIVYYAGHGDTNGPWYSSRAYDSAGLQMIPANYRWGRNEAAQPTLRWAVWSACLTLYDDVRDSSYVNWWNPPNPVSRWFQAFQGMHGILGMRSLGWQGDWVQYDFPWWYWHDTRDRAAHFVNLLYDGYTFNDAWFIANRRTVYDHMDEGFEAAALWAHAEGNDYAAETLLAPYPDYVGTPGGFTYHWYRIGSPPY